MAIFQKGFENMCILHRKLDVLIDIELDPCILGVVLFRLYSSHSDKYKVVSITQWYILGHGTSLLYVL